MSALKDKADWQRKVFDESIVGKWRLEALQFSAARKPESADEVVTNAWKKTEDSGENGESLDLDGEQRQTIISQAVFDYCIAELRDNAKQDRQRGFTQAIDANACVFMSDSAIPSATKTALQQAAARLEDVKAHQKDWHPGSDGKVLDLVHPSLFPLLYGRSRMMPTGAVPTEKCAWYTGRGSIVPEADIQDTDYSDHFQWLPCDVATSDNGRAKISSYINNLYPHGNMDLYAAIEDVITASVPLWTETLLSTQFLATHRIKDDFGDGRIEKPRPSRRSDEDDAHYDDWHNAYDAAIPEPKTYALRQRVQPKVFVPDDPNYKDPGQKTAATKGWRLSDIDQPLKNPSIEPSQEQIAEGDAAMEEERKRLQNVFQKQGMQVIVKLANIHLTPDRPTYDGGSWHIEGQLNEHIAASALYYYDTENITDSYLAFREGVDKDELNDYEQSECYALMEIYGIRNYWGNAIQVLGMTNTREDRLLVFPNVLQHRVSPFELKDKAKPGHRKLLALFLVDPFIRIPSTSNVPPQQREWWARAMEEKGTLSQKLPMELVDQIIEDVEDFPITLEEAKELRGQLIEERKVYVNDSMQPYQNDGYCFCEH
ncbi:hypothetical protein CLAFUW4_00328 [Fulvia fulva]|uniref:Uncharacterized protein n=1 Tax=Passalora fulva TaxID=5499 RepID=A0A9Q8L944_PASFU|nr:uncharacterized protein CLAFUR5_00327 [Fulvia fulva]KAK4634837.1 hypothetical protein CLAFUR4_00328 [Fulvia fulva]UJO12473.1 hypothetical protein CLAFUR5_00327 [Fulvia fulva]WPV10074.1 hypothetical protein CLAFUW4_00328 [Fulvia fulva]WPV24340.1 hypothetical protein CLAFUW7_00332 [Fulvia fulva]